jgi:hydrogenase maturation protein HypF
MPPVLAVGGELKNTICLTKKNRAFLSQHIGDMENLETYEFFLLTMDHLRRILEIRPEVLAHDLHPDYLGSKFAREQQDLPLSAVQHHHAHIVSCMSENGIEKPVIGLALDGTGLGSDGAVWGGEVLLADLVSFKRAAHFEYLPMPGGDAAARSPWRMGVSFLYKAFGQGFFDLSIPFVQQLDPSKTEVIIRMIDKGVNAPPTSSCGRLFDAVAALIGLRRENRYEGQAPVELEMAQARGEAGTYAWRSVEQGGTRVILTTDIIRAVVEDLIKGVLPAVISSRFHNTLVALLSDLCVDLRKTLGIEGVALSGGAFQNRTLLEGFTRSLSERSFRVYSHREVPTNDGGLSLGQAVCAGMKANHWEGAFSRPSATKDKLLKPE